jgi:uncharacterized protein (DUF1800 family)
MMKLTRRALLQAGGKLAGSGLALMALTGCERAPWTYLPGWQESLLDTEKFIAPPTQQIDFIAHVLLRTSFGLRGGDYGRVAALGTTPEAAVNAYIEEQLSPLTVDDRKLQAAVRRLDILQEPLAEFYEYKEPYLDAQLQKATLLRAIYSRRQLYEVMVQFWTDHFNIDSSKGECKWLKAADDRDVIRRYALGNFADLLRASALSPAMLWYLDGRVNQKQQNESKPNENYARELLELHTLGVHGGYSQTDVMEVARCLTGWTVRDKKWLRKGTVVFQPDQHDDGVKHVLGQTIPAGLGKEDLTQVLAILAQHPATAQHIAHKLCRRFIADEPPVAACQIVAQAFLQSQGDIPTLLRALFATEAFRTTRGNKLRRPFEFIVAALRATQAQCDAGDVFTDYLTRMGHTPFHYPTPDGYPLQATPWLGTLLWRWNFAVALTEERVYGTKINVLRLRDQAGGDAGLMAALLGRQATAEENAAYDAAGNGLALLLASPAFQYC